MKLERVSPPPQQESVNGNLVGGEEGGRHKGYSGLKTEEEVEEDELRNWADFRECQTRFAASGGVLTEF